MSFIPQLKKKRKRKREWKKRTNGQYKERGANPKKEQQQEQMLEIKNKKQKTTVTKMKNAIAGFISKLEITENKNVWAQGPGNRILENQKAKRTKTERKERISKDCGMTPNGVTYA